MAEQMPEYLAKRISGPKPDHITQSINHQGVEMDVVQLLVAQNLCCYHWMFGTGHQALFYFSRERWGSSSFPSFPLFLSPVAACLRLRSHNLFQMLASQPFFFNQPCYCWLSLRSLDPQIPLTSPF